MCVCEVERGAPSKVGTGGLFVGVQPSVEVIGGSGRKKAARNSAVVCIIHVDGEAGVGEKTP
jgi:hypothetical protein